MATTKQQKVPKSKFKTKKDTLLSEEEYLEKELLAETKSEYHAGKIVAMAGATYIHNLIVSKLARHLGNCMEEKSCEVVSSDMLVYLEECKKYVYPDVLVICKKAKFVNKAKGRAEALKNPQIVIEVLSKGTAEYDMGEKMKCYLTLKSLKQYVIVSSERKLIIVYTKDKNEEVTVKTYQENQEVLIGECKIPIEKIYKKVSFDMEEK